MLFLRDFHPSLFSQDNGEIFKPCSIFCSTYSNFLQASQLLHQLHSLLLFDLNQDVQTGSLHLLSLPASNAPTLPQNASTHVSGIRSINVHFGKITELNVLPNGKPNAAPRTAPSITFLARHGNDPGTD